MQSCRVLPMSGDQDLQGSGFVEALGLTRKTCKRMKGLPKTESQKANMHEGAFLSPVLTMKTCMKWFV